MVVNLLKNQPKQFQLDLSLDIKSNFKDESSPLSFSETLKSSPKNEIETSHKSVDRKESYSSHKMEERDSYLEEKPTKNEKPEEAPKTQIEKNTDEKKEGNNSDKRTEKKENNLEDDEKKVKKTKKLKLEELVFLDINISEKIQLSKVQKKSSNEDLDDLEKIIHLVKLKEPNSKQRIKELTEENNHQIDKKEVNKTISKKLKENKMSEELLENLITKKESNLVEDLEDNSTKPKNKILTSKLEKENEKLEDLVLNEMKKSGVKEEKPIEKNENISEKSKNLNTAFLKENLESKNEKAETKNVKVAQSTEKSNTENLENLGNFKDSNQKQEGFSQAQKDFTFNIDQKQNSKLNQTEISKEMGKQSFSPKDLKANFKDLVQSARVNIIGKGQTSAEIQMNPKELGKMSLKISMIENQIKGIITVDSEVVKNILSMEMNSLKQDLKDAGFSLDFLNIDLADDKEKNNQFAKLFQEEMQNSLKENYQSESDDFEIEEIENQEKMVNLASKKIDIKA